MILHKLKPNSNLQVSHESELLRLSRQVARLSAQLNSISVGLSDNGSRPIAHDKVLVLDGNIHRLIKYSKILYCEAKGNYCSVKTAEHSYLVSKTLKQFASGLPTHVFIRCHQSYVVNIQHIVGYAKVSSALEVHLPNEIKLPVSRRKQSHVVELLNGYTSP